MKTASATPSTIAPVRTADGKVEITFSDRITVVLDEASAHDLGKLLVQLARVEQPETNAGYAIYATDGKRDVVYVQERPEAEPFPTVQAARDHLAGEGGVAGDVRAWAVRLVLDTEI